MKGARAAVVAALILYIFVPGSTTESLAQEVGEPLAFGWERVYTPTTMPLYGVRGSGSKAIAVGANGVGLVFDGVGWGLVDTPTQLPFEAVWIVPGGDIFAVGAMGNIYRFAADGSPPVRMESGWNIELLAVWGRSDDDVYAAGVNGTILHYDGRQWSYQLVPTMHRLRGIFGSPNGAVYAVGDYGRIFRSNGDGEWKLMETGTVHNLYALWVISDDVIYAVGDAGWVLRGDGERWTQMDTPTMYNLYGVWGDRPDNVYAVGTRGLVMHYDGVQWTEGRIGTWASLNAIANGFIVGDGGLLFQNRQLYPEVNRLRITEVDAVNGRVEVTNTGPRFLSGDHSFCHLGDCDSFIPQGTEFAAGGIKVFPVAGLDNHDSDLWLYRTYPFSDPANVVHGVQYGRKDALGSTDVAVAAGKWPGAGASTPAAPLRATIAYDGFGDTPADWYVDETPTMGEPDFTEPGTVERVLYYPSGTQTFDDVLLGDEVEAVRDWSIADGSAVDGMFTSHVVGDVLGQADLSSGRWVRVRDQDPGDNVNRIYSPTIQTADGDDVYRWSFRVYVEQPAAAGGAFPRIMVQHPVESGPLTTEVVDMWGVELRADAAYLVVDPAGGEANAVRLGDVNPGLAGWIPITLDVNLADGDVAAYVDGILRDKLPISPSEGTDPTLFRLSYDGEGPGNVATVLLDEVGVEVLNPVPMFREVHAAASASGATVWWSFYAGDSIDGFKLCRHSGSEIDDVVISGDALLGADVRRFEDNDLESGETYYYRVVAVRSDGTEIQSGTATVKSTEIWPDNRPAPYALTHGHPNPFSTSTSFEYTLAETGPVTVRVYDVRGALVSTLENAVRAGGVHAISWDGRDNRGNRVSGGTYFVELRTPKAVLTRKIVLVR